MGGGDKVSTQTEKAAKLKISQNYFSQIYNGRRHPGYPLVQRLQALGIRKPFEWWRTAKLGEIQKMLDTL